MSEKKESQRMQMVHFLDIDTKKITFQKPKAKKYNGSQIGVLNNGKRMYVKYKGFTPFGLKENFDKDGYYQGTSMQINCEAKYLQKAKELDWFFINASSHICWELAGLRISCILIWISCILMWISCIIKCLPPY